ncbi:MAG: UDP-N-acetylmuramoyl-tripeptide--D-alanyl-D-alanine ligase [Sulfuricurvum sp.]|uniref:Mur ligase family protein n=1 Tax=Sulfuricurvum sp. TaxID=2025608 RepID=UPI002628D3DD|nr:UDP-N-acetylmuramoyl-tripeptide--D-alanyl-D-alanine ligase [Sulfuricurvum sp.]MDD2951012.1 UDP-N-acetylmuramoyl-tripeptide--D-alanyl-D-alanine ligase [Sulfuricurvum sp.]MDD5118304.1 UDP-N-acetylmuramoyl-tripeptide--D-alanyl-D-alanine ligase [Sulfuricurvum sp.]
MDFGQTFAFLTNIIFVMTLGWYLITNLQWYDYRIERVVLRHHKTWWHIVYFIIPFVSYYVLGDFFWIFFYLLIIPAILMWHLKLDKKLVMTWRVKRFLILLFSVTLLLNFLLALKEASQTYSVFIPLVIAYLGSWGIEKFLFTAYKRQAKQKIASMQDLTIICVTGSYGKTSMKNFIAQVLGQKFNVYATPRSVNTLGGIIRDVNESLPAYAQVYICEAGAREVGDIYAIAQLLHPQIVVVGKVGPQHLEYFKTLERIQRTKLEIIQSNRLKRAFVHTSVTNEPHEKVTFFGDDIHNLVATLEGIDFDLNVEGSERHFHTSVLGGFQTININAAILIASEMGMKGDEIVSAVEKLKSVEHRLERIDAGGKIILDDGYNGNIDGMLEGVRLCSLHTGRKVIVTPGLVESTEELNGELISAINKVFDIAIITGSLNAVQFDKELTVEQKIMLSDKSQMVKTLGEVTKAGDIILFANDAPNFI